MRELFKCTNIVFFPLNLYLTNVYIKFHNKPEDIKQVIAQQMKNAIHPIVENVVAN